MKFGTKQLKWHKNTHMIKEVTKDLTKVTNDRKNHNRPKK